MCKLFDFVSCRFEEKCWTVEEELCKTVYDTILEKKCETVNITVPQRECKSIQEMVMKLECTVVNEIVTLSKTSMNYIHYHQQPLPHTGVVNHLENKSLC